MTRVALTTIFLFFFSYLFAQKEEQNKIYLIPDEYSKIHHEGEQALLQ